MWDRSADAELVITSSRLLKEIQAKRSHTSHKECRRHPDLTFPTKNAKSILILQVPDNYIGGDIPLLHSHSPLVPEEQYRTGDEYGRVGPYHHTHHQGVGKIIDYSAAEDKEEDNHDQRGY